MFTRGLHLKAGSHVRVSAWPTALLSLAMAYEETHLLEGPGTISYLAILDGRICGICKVKSMRYP